jgi:hypothetical protein
MSNNANLEKIIIQTSILFVSIASVIGLTLGGMFQQYKLAYISLGKMLYYSVPFVIASLVAFISLIGEDHTANKALLLKKVAWSFYLTGFISILLLASLAAQTEVLPEGFFFTLKPIDIVIWQFIAFSIILVGQLLAKGKSARWAPFFCLILLGGVFLMLCGTFQTSNVEKSGEFAPERQNFCNATAIDLEQGQQVLGKLQSLNNEARFSYYLLSANEYSKMNANANYITTSALAQDYYVNQASFLKTVQSSGKYYLLMRNEYFLGHNVTYSITVYKTQTQYSSLGILLAIFGTSGLSSYALAIAEQENPLTKVKTRALMCYQALRFKAFSKMWLIVNPHIS